MKDRKQHVLNMAHQLFIDKGFQATSIQDILEYSGISKGTFYNYFASKNELLIAIFKTLYIKMEKSRNELLIGQDPSDIDIFIVQIELHLEMNRANNLSTLFEEVHFLNDDELKSLIKNGHLRMVNWLHSRFLDIFPKNEPYLLDCAIMFLGILNQNYKYFQNEINEQLTLKRVVAYSVNRIVALVHNVSMTNEQLFPPETLTSWMPNCKKSSSDFQQNLQYTIRIMKKSLHQSTEPQKHIELLDFIYDELIHNKKPRKHLLQSVIQLIKNEPIQFQPLDVEQLEFLIQHYFESNELL